MAKIRTVQTDFRAGELDPLLRMRTDIPAYKSGGRKLRNVLIYNTGAVSRRPSTRFIRTMPSNTLANKLFGFEFDDNEKYIIALSNNRLDVLDASGNLVTNFTGATNCPWTTAQLPNVTVTQAADVMIICHRSWNSRVLRRTGSTSFTISQYAFDESADSKVKYQPYLKFEDPTATLQPSAISGSITITSSVAMFTSSYVGTIIRLYGCEVLITAFTNATTITGTVRKDLKRNLDPNPFRTIDGSRTVEVTDINHGLATGASITVSGSNDIASISKNNYNGAHTVTVIDDDHYTFTHAAANVATESTDGGGPAVKISTTAPTRSWDEQVFSVKRGFPGAVSFHEDRLWFAGTTEVPDGLWSSKVGLYFNFNVGDGLDDESIQVSVGTARISNIRHLMSNRTFQIFSEAGEFVAEQLASQPLTPKTMSIRRQTAYGCSSVPPVPFDGATMFVQANNKTVREFIYADSQASYVAADLTTISQHLFNAPKDLAVLYGSTTRPEQLAFVINGDGTLAVFQSIRSEGLAAWTPWSSASGPGQAGTFDQIIVLGNRVFVTVLRFNSYQLEEVMIDDQNYTLDCATKQTNGAAIQTWTLSPNLYRNRTVKVTSGNYYLGEFAVSSGGSFTLPSAVTAIQVGFDFTVEIEPMPPDFALANGPATGAWKRINRVIVHLASALSLKLEGRTVTVRHVGQNPADPPIPLDGKYQLSLLGYDRDRTVLITQGEPLPMKLLGLIMEVAF